MHMTGLEKLSRNGMIGRGYGFLHWTADPDLPFYPMSSQSFGHNGFTGITLWIDPERDSAIALLTNEVSNGRYERKILEFRRRVFAALPAFLEEE